jgi:hypothetical protein
MIIHRRRAGHFGAIVQEELSRRSHTAAKHIAHEVRRMQQLKKTGAFLAAAACVIAVATPASSAHHTAAVAVERTEGVYGPYTFLLGEWDVQPASAAEPNAVMRFAWGRGRAYMLFSTSLFIEGREEPHFEGMLMWNGVHKHLDMLAALDLREGRVQEQGRMYQQPDGEVVREITAYYSEGARGPRGEIVGVKGGSTRFRQTFKSIGPDAIETSLLRETPEGWAPTFPGSEKALMTRRSKKSAAH